MTDSSPNSIDQQSRGKTIPWWTWPIIVLILFPGLFFVGWQWQYNQPESHYQRGREALKAGDDDVVLAESEFLSQTAGFESHAKLLRGLLLVRKGKLADALSELALAGDDATVVEASSNAAKCFYQLGQYVNTIDAANVALSRDASAIDARRWLAAAYYDLGAVGSAVAELEQISREAKGDSRPDRLLGLISKDSEQYQKAIAHYRESLRRDPKQPDREKILNELAESLVKQNLFAEAMSVLKESQRSALVLTLEADCQYALGETTKAHELLSQAIRLDGRCVPAKLSQGKLFLDAGQADQAELILNEAVQLDPFNRVTHLQLSQALRQLGKSQKADDELQRSQEIKSLEREFTDLHETAMQQPLDAEVRYRLGELAEKLGKPELSKMWFRTALSIDPHHSGAQNGLIQADPATNRDRTMK
jgi:tetratricopeptide (TPR) repeat protein